MPFDKRRETTLISTVLRALKQYGTEGERADVRSTMPKDLAAVVP